VSATDRPRWLVVVACVMAIAAGALPEGAWAQQATVSDADIARVRREQPTITADDIARTQARYGQLPVETPPSSAPRSTPNLDALPMPLHATPLDLGAVADGYRQQPLAPTGLDDGPVLYLFVSLSMPEPSLRRIIAQAAQARATVLVRGLSEGSLRVTAARLQALIGQRPVSIQIDPRPFDQFGIQRVPAFVLARSVGGTDCGSGACQAGADFVRTTGDVSLDYALAYVQRTAPAWAPAAARYLQRLEPRE